MTLLYNSADPEDAQILSWTQLPVMLFVFTFGFAMLILFFWIVLIISEGHSYDDPIHLLPKLISQFHLNRLHFPVMFFLLLIPMIFGMVTFSLIKDGLDLRANGVKVIGHVTVSREQTTTSLSDNRTSIGTYMWISFKDASGKEYTIRRSLARPFTHLKPGEAVEVIYPANRPDTAVVNVWDELFLAPLFIGFIVVAFLYLPWMYYRARN